MTVIEAYFIGVSIGIIVSLSTVALIIRGEIKRANTNIKA